MAKKQMQLLAIAGSCAWLSFPALSRASELFRERPASTPQRVVPASQAELQGRDFYLALIGHVSQLEQFKNPKSSLARLENLAVKKQDKAAEMLWGLLTDPAYAVQNERAVFENSTRLGERVARQARAIQEDPKLQAVLQKSSMAFASLQRSRMPAAAPVMVAKKKLDEVFDGSGQQAQVKETEGTVVIEATADHPVERVSSRLAAPTAVVHERRQLIDENSQTKTADVAVSRRRTISKGAFAWTMFGSMVASGFLIEQAGPGSALTFMLAMFAAFGIAIFHVIALLFLLPHRKDRFDLSDVKQHYLSTLAYFIMIFGFFAALWVSLFSDKLGEKMMDLIRRVLDALVPSPNGTFSRE